VSRAYANGKYSPASDSGAGIAIKWLDGSGATLGVSKSSSVVRNTTDWTPLEVSAAAPAVAAQAQVVLYTSCPNEKGIAGSVWFDDVALTGQSAPNPLTVSAITPATAASGASASATITGTAFEAGAAVRLVSGTTTVEATDVTVKSANEITCSLPLTGAVAGTYDVVVTNPDSKTAKLTGGFSVTAAASSCGTGTTASVSLFAAMVGLLSLAGVGRRRKKG
jgi:hypothetical protein